MSAARKIHEAVENGDDCKVIELTSSCCFTLGQVVDARDPKTAATPLMTAAVRGDEGIAKILLSRGASINAKDAKDQMAFHIAASKGHIKCMGLFLEHGALLEAKTLEGLTPLLLAITHSIKGRPAPILFLLDHGASTQATTPTEKGGYTPFLLAVKLGHKTIADLLLEKSVNMSVDGERDIRGNTGFMLAVLGGNKTMADFLLSKGADINATDSEGSTVLLRVCEKDDSAGASSRLDMATYLLQHKADFTCKAKHTGHTPLMLAALQGDKPLLELLLAHGADMNEKDEKAYTALFHAAEKGHKDIVQLLVTRGANVVFLAPTSTNRRSLSNSWNERDKEMAGNGGGRSLSLSTSLSTSQQQQGGAVLGPTAESVAANDEIRAIVHQALVGGPPVLSQAPEVRKDKLDPMHPSVLVHFAPPLPTPSCPRSGALRYRAECYLVTGSEKETRTRTHTHTQEQESAMIGLEGEEGESDTNTQTHTSTRPVAVLNGLHAGHTPAVFRGLTRTQTYIFKVYAESALGRGMAAVTGPVFLSTAPNTWPSIQKIEEGESESESERVSTSASASESGEEMVVEKGTMIVHLDPPKDNGGSAITSYLLIVKPGNLKVETQVNTDTHTHIQTTLAVVKGLEKGKSYRISAAAKNLNGVGPFSNVMNFEFAT